MFGFITVAFVVYFTQRFRKWKIGVEGKKPFVKCNYLKKYVAKEGKFRKINVKIVLGFTDLS